MGDVALRNPQALRHERRDQIPVRIVPDDQIRPGPQGCQHFFFGFNAETLDVFPYLKTRNPMRNNFSLRSAERNPDNAGVFGSVNRLNRLIACGMGVFGYQPAHDQNIGFDIDALFLQPFTHFPFQRFDLIQNIHHLPSRIGHAQYPGLRKVSVGG